VTATAAIPEIRKIPWFGVAPWLLTHPGRFFLEGYRRHGPIFRFRFLGAWQVAMVGAEANRLIFADQRERFSHARGYAEVTPLLGDGLLFQDGAVHARNRRLMTPAFHQRGVNRYFDVMRACARTHVARWAREGRGGMYDRFRRLTFEIMARLVLGVRGDVEIERLSHLNDRLARALTAFPRTAWSWTRYGRGVRARDELRAYLRGVIRSRREEPGDDALGLLMAARDEAGDALGEDDLVEQAVILMFAGHETTTSMLTSLLEALRCHPDTHERLVREQHAVVGDGELELDHLKRLELLDLVLKEVERLWPPICLLQRGVVADFELAGHGVPAGASIMFSPWATHRLPELFADPHRFDPERFAAPRREDWRVPYALIGFGGGPRLCIGEAFAKMEAKVVASVLLRDHRWSLDAAPPRLRYVPTLHPAGGLPATITRTA
jgi:retinoid hydroxylase